MVPAWNNILYILVGRSNHFFVNAFLKLVRTKEEKGEKLSYIIILPDATNQDKKFRPGRLCLICIYILILRS